MQEDEGSCGSDNERRRHCRRLWQQVKAVERPEFEANNTKLQHEMCRLFEESWVSVESSPAVNDWQIR